MLKQKIDGNAVWYKEYWETILHCNFNTSQSKKKCTGDEILSEAGKLYDISFAMTSALSSFVVRFQERSEMCESGIRCFFHMIQSPKSNSLTYYCCKGDIILTLINLYRDI